MSSSRTRASASNSSRRSSATQAPSSGRSMSRASKAEPEAAPKAAPEAVPEAAPEAEAAPNTPDVSTPHPLARAWHVWMGDAQGLKLWSVGTFDTVQLF